jgi:hypothetical protein
MMGMVVVMITAEGDAIGPVVMSGQHKERVAVRHASATITRRRHGHKAGDEQQRHAHPRQGPLDTHQFSLRTRRR